MSRIAVAEAANDPASVRKATPGPNAAINHPPSAGPMNRTASGRTNWPSEFACSSSSRGTSCGTIAVNAGVKSALPTPYTATRQTTCQSSSAPVTARTPIVAIAAPRIASESIIT
jgi:hypothetical protein